MTLAAPPPDEALRLTALLDCRVLDTPPEAAFDAITASAARLCGVPIALISLVDDDRQWFKSHHGLAVQQTARRDSFCAHALHQSTVLVVPDASLDERFADNPLVTGEPKIRYYAGAPLVTAQGSVLGTLCVIDREPRQLEPWQLNALGALARHAVSLLELRRAGVQLAPAAPPGAAVWAPTAEPKARLVATALALALVLLVAAGWVVARGLLDLRNSALEATEQRGMLFESSALLGHLQAAEAGQRGYLLSGDEAYLAPYAQALASIPGHLGAITRLNLASSDPGVDLVSLTPLVDAKLAELARGIDLRRRQPEVDAAALVRAGLGKDTTERIRQQLDREGVPIYRRLETKVGLVIASSTQALNWFAAGSALSLTLLLLAFAGLRREVARRQRAALELHRAKADVEQQVRERTREVVQTNEALRERSEYLRHIGDNLPGGVLFRSLLHADGRRHFLYASAGVERLHGVSANHGGIDTLHEQNF